MTKISNEEQKILKSRYLSICLLIFGFIFSFLFINAALADGIIIKPIRVEELVDPGKVMERKINVVNNSDYPQTMHAYLMDFTAEGEEGKANLIVPGTEKGNFLTSWINISNEGIEFKPWEEKEIPFTISVPYNTGPGGYYGAIIFGTKPPGITGGVEDDKGAAIAISQQAGTLLLFQVSGEAIEKANIKEFSTDKSFYSAPFEIKFLTRIENQGNVHIKPHGTIVISNMLGRESALIRVNDIGSNVLPNSTRRFENTWEGKFGIGRYKAIIALSYGTSADLGGQGKQTVFQEKYFWIFPWKIIIPFFLGLIVLIAIFYLFLKIYKNKAINKALKDMGMVKERYVKKYQGPSPVRHFSMILFLLLLFAFILAGVIYFIFFA